MSSAQYDAIYEKAKIKIANSESMSENRWRYISLSLYIISRRLTYNK